MISKKNTIKAPSSRYKRTEKIKDFLCVTPALIVLAIFVYYPIVNLFRISFTNWNLINDQYKYVGLKNYIWLFQGSGVPEWFNSLRITFTYTLGEISITLIGGILLAALFNKMTSSFSFMRSIVFMPKYIAISTSAIVFSWILNGDYGILNYVLQLFGIGKTDWLTSQSTALISVLFLTAWRVVGYAMIIYLSAMKGISTDYYEAASLDGASSLQRFRYITLPLLSPTTLFLFVTTFISSMKVFQSIDVMTAGGPYKSTNVMVYWIYDLAFVDFRVDRAATVSCVFFVILLVFTVATMKISNKNVHYDS
jgi:ABC-type sugar transport system permease subunit